MSQRIAIPDGGAGKSFRRHADDRQHLTVDRQRAIDDVGIRAEVAAPVLVAEHDDGALAHLRLVLSPDETTERRL